MADFATLTARLAAEADRLDGSFDWPVDGMAALAEAGANRWVIPRAYGGDELPPEKILEGYEAVGRGSLAVILILTQRDGACDLLASCPNETAKRAWLPRLAAGKAFTTVGISQVTTSHQAGPPALTATPESDGGYVLRGFMPWATGADRSDFIVTAAVLPDRRQILAAVEREAAGLRVEPPMAFMALQCARTSRVVCENVRIDGRHVLCEPREKALATRSTVKPMVVSSAGLGLAGALLDEIDAVAGKSPAELNAAVGSLRAMYGDVRERLYASARAMGARGAESPSSELRVAVNEVVIKLALAAMTFAKGTGYVMGHRVQRLVREAMFFLVWSAPDEIRVETLVRVAGTAQSPTG